MAIETNPVSEVSGIRGIEVRSIDWVPDTERHGKVWHQGPLWFLGNFQYFTIPIGFVGPAFGLSLWWTILAGTLGILIGTVFMAFHAAQGPTFGLPQMIQSRAQFGFRGVVVALFAALFTYMAFNVADQVLLAGGLHGAFGWNATAVAIVATVGAALLAIYGYDWVHRIFRLLLYILLPLIAIITIGVITGHAGGAAPKTPYGFNWTGFMAQLSAAAAYNITYACYVSDYSRYLPTQHLQEQGDRVGVRRGHDAGGLADRAGRLAGHPARCGRRPLRPADGRQPRVQSPWHGGRFRLGRGIGGDDGHERLRRHADDTGRASTRSARSRPTRRARVITILVLTVIWFVIAKAITTSAVGVVDTALTLMLYLLVPWTTTNLIDFFFVRRGHYSIIDIFKPHGIYGVWSPRGLLAYGIGFAAEVPFMVLLNLVTLKSYYTGPLASKINSVDISWIVGAVVTGIAYWLLTRNLDVAAEQGAIKDSEKVLEEIDEGSEFVSI